MRIALIIFFIPFICASQKLFVDESRVSFFSWAPLEDISAISNQLEGVVDFDTGDFFFRIPIRTFDFPSSLMQKHFNEKYMESDKYTTSIFKGNFNEKVSLDSIEKNNILAQGVLKIHGQEKLINIPTKIFVRKDSINFEAEFNVILTDYNIKVPKVVRMNIADTIQINVSGKLIN